MSDLLPVWKRYYTGRAWDPNTLTWDEDASTDGPGPEPVWEWNGQQWDPNTGTWNATTPPPPTIPQSTGCSPSTGSAGASLTLTITGVGFDQVDNVFVSDSSGMNAYYPDNWNIISPTQLTMTFMSGLIAGQYYICVHSPTWGTSTSTSLLLTVS